MTNIGVATMFWLSTLAGQFEPLPIVAWEMVPVVQTCREEPTPFGDTFRAWQDVTGRKIEWCHHV